MPGRQQKGKHSEFLTFHLNPSFIVIELGRRHRLGRYGLITWHQLRHFGRPSHIAFKNPDFVKYAESFGAKGYRVEKAADLVPTLKRAFDDNTVVIIDCPVDYAENMKLTSRLKELKSPL